MKNPHEVLGVSPLSTEDEIKQAYRRAAMKYHPDRGGNPTQFHQIKKAYDKLLKEKASPCPQCDGSGFIVTKQGIFVRKDPCKKCWGIK